MLNAAIAAASGEHANAWMRRPLSPDESKQSHHPHGARRKVKRRYRRNQDAVNFLRRFTLAVVVIDLMLAISESSLISTFFLYMTLSTTFDVKPENVIETYCYYAPVGNNMCEDYMDRLTGYTSSASSSSPLNHYSRGGSGNSPSTSSPIINITQAPPPPSENHFPTIPLRPRLTEEESYQLFLIYNLSFYDPPARFNLASKLDRNSKLSKLYSQLVFDLSQNEVVMQNRSNVRSTVFNISIPLSNDSNFLKSFRQTVEVISPSAPNLRNEIPQVTTAIRRTAALQKLRRAMQDSTGAAAAFLPIPPSKFWETNKYLVLDDNQTPIFRNAHKSLIQIRDFIRHRWKRNARARPTTTKSSTSFSAFVTGSIEVSAMQRPQTPLQSRTTSATTTTGKMMSTEATNRMPTPDQAISKQELMQSKHESTQPTDISNTKIFSSDIDRSNNINRGGDDDDGGIDTKANIRSGVMSGDPKRKGERLETPLINSELGTAGHNQPRTHATTPFPEIQSPPTTQQHSKHTDGRKVRETERGKVLMREMYKVMTQREKYSGAPEPSSKNDLELIISAAESNLNAFTNVINTNSKLKANGHKPPSPHSSPGQSQTKRKNQKWKDFQELFAKLERSPRSLIGLMESSLFNNWKCFLEKARRRAMLANGECTKLDPQCAGMTIPVTRPDEKRLDQVGNLMLNMEMNIFSPETYQKAERRKRAMQQVYHDYSSTILGELTGLKEIPVSRTFYTVHSTVKFYTLAWQIVICLVLFFGSVYEDKTALNIWGIFNILTSLLHFLVDEWINTTFKPEKTSAAIWFGVVYGVYKPITILLVATLSSEILKSTSGAKQKGLWGNLREIIKGRKRPPLPNTIKYLEKLGEVIVVKDGEKIPGNNYEKNDDNENNNSGGITMKVNLVEFRNDKAIVRPCSTPPEKLRTEILRKNPCYVFTASEAGDMMKISENGSTNFRAVRIDTENMERLSDKQLALLLEELKMLPSCVYTERALTCDALAEELSDTDSEEDEDQLDIVEDADDDSDSDMGEDGDTEEAATTVENSHYYCHKELEDRQSRQDRKVGLSSISKSFVGGGGVDGEQPNATVVPTEVPGAGGLSTNSGLSTDKGNSLNVSACLNQEELGTNPPIVDGGNVHI